MTKIEKFEGKYKFLSNFVGSVVSYEGVEYPSVENAYQAAKCLDPVKRVPLQTCTAAEAKKKGKKLPMRSDWDEVKLEIMRDLLLQKFSQPTFRGPLLLTGDAIMIEGNWWGDTYWGMCKGKGQNHLGRLLMEIRDNG